VCKQTTRAQEKGALAKYPAYVTMIVDAAATRAFRRERGRVCTRDGGGARAAAAAGTHVGTPEVRDSEQPRTLKLRAMSVGAPARRGIPTTMPSDGAGGRARARARSGGV
jgi:hypothetical protein